MLYVEITPDGETAIINDNYVRGDFPRLTGSLATSAFGAASADLRSGQIIAVADVNAETKLSAAEKAAFTELNIYATAGIPLNNGGRWVAVLGVHHGEPRRWRDEEIALLQETAERTWAAVERARAEEALRESEEKFRTLSDTAPALIWYNDAAGENRFINQQFLDFTGMTAEEISGAGWQTLVHPDDRDADVADYLAAVAERRVWSNQNRIRRYDGEWCWFDNYARPLFDASGAYLGHVGVTVDITERKRAEAALRQSEEKYRTLFDSIDEGFCIIEVLFDENGQPFDFRYIEANPAFERQSGLVGAVGKTIREFAPAHEQYWFDNYGRVVKTGEPVRFENKAEQLGRFYDVYAFRFGAANANLAAVLFTDITERKRQEEALRESEERLRRLNEELEERVRRRTLELAATNKYLQSEVQERRTAEEQVKRLLRQLITVQEEERRRIARELHDTLGQQLAALRLSIEMLKSKADEQRDMQAEADRMWNIFQSLDSDVDFLAWELRPASLDHFGLSATLENFVQEWSKHFRIRADYHGLGADGSRLPAEVETNLYRILQEALQNVHKHSGASRVNVLLERRGQEVVLIVEDDGNGYDPEAEVAAASSKGMGVVNMRERAALVGGQMEIETSPGEGVTIYVRVPLKNTD